VRRQPAAIRVAQPPSARLRRRRLSPTSDPISRKDAAMTTLYQALMLILNVVWYVMVAHIIMSWLINFQVLNLRQPLVSQIWDGLSRLLEPIYQPIRNILPNTGGLDLAPLVVFIGLIILQQALANNAGFFLGY
jgi:YggT family protein